MIRQKPGEFPVAKGVFREVGPRGGLPKKSRYIAVSREDIRNMKFRLPPAHKGNLWEYRGS